MKKYLLKTLCLCMVLVLVGICFGCTQEPQGTEDPAETEEGLSLVADAVLSESSYSLGEQMGDYTLTDIEGKTYSFSEILEEKEAIVLNFWYINCGPCKLEFPYLDEAYGLNSDKVEVLAINCSDTTEDIKEFAEEWGLSFPMIQGDIAWESSIGIMGYPTTVVVDRFGTVTMKHTGYIENTDTFCMIFEYFTAEDYVQTVVRNIEEII